MNRHQVPFGCWNWFGWCSGPRQ